MSESSPIPQPTRIVTGKATNGDYTIQYEGPLEFTPAGKGPMQSLLWDADALSPLKDGPDTGKAGTGMPPSEPGRVKFWVADVPPGAKSPMHRTPTLDYVIIARGELTMTVGDMSERVFKAGDVLVQRGTVHTWENRSKEWARMFAVCTGAEE